MQTVVIVLLVAVLAAVVYFARKYILAVVKKTELKVVGFVLDHMVSPMIKHFDARLQAIEKVIDEKFPPTVH